MRLGTPTQRARPVARAALALGIALGAAVVPRAALAHAAFVSSEPAPGEELGSAPGVVVLRFTEPLIPRLSRAVVTDPNGRRFEGGPSAEREIRVPLATSVPGVYEVEWKTVSPVDGHTLRGRFRFGVGTAPGEGAEGETGFAPQRSDLLIAVARTVEYAAVLLSLGMLLLGRLARRDPPLAWVRPGLPAALGVALAGGLVVVTGEALAAAASPSPGAVASYLTSGLAGTARLVRVAAETLALATALLGGRATLSLAASVVALAAAGHAAAVRPRWWGVGVDAAHLASAGLWAGGILALAALRPPGGWRGEEARRLLDRFSPVAVTAFLVTVGTGILRGTQELARLADLVTTSYGQVLSAKVVGVVAMVPLSVLAWRRLARTPRLEAGVALFVVAAAALLAAYPLPPARLGEAEAAEQRRQASTQALPRRGELTLGGEAGEVLVGVTLRPGRPGPNEALVYVLPLEGEDAAPGIAVRLSIGGREVRTEECGPTCRRAEAELRGGEGLGVLVGGERGGKDVLEIPDLPAPDGTELFRRMQERMHELRTYRLEETLSSGRARIRSTYEFQAPDRMRIELDTGLRNVTLGGTRYLREGPDARWEKGDALPPRVPFFIWDTAREVSPRIVGKGRVEGVSTTILSFYGPSGRIPIWYRLWVDGEGLVRRAEMRAQGHFMDHRYFAFDDPFTIEPPLP